MSAPHVPILIVLPVSGYDSRLAVEQVEFIADFTPCPNNPCLVVYCPDVPKDHRERIDAAVKRGFARQYYFEPQLPYSAEGWPKGPNFLFKEVVDFLETRASYAWFFLEPDMTPLRPGWIEALEEEYFKTADTLPFMGVIQQSWSPDRQPRDFHLVGCSIYHRDLPRFTRQYRIWDSYAFDVMMQQDLVGVGKNPYNALHCKHTNQIAHRWLSEKYHRAPDGLIHCEPAEGRLPGQKAFAIATPIPECAVLSHGCKDLSLVRLLRAEFSGATATSPSEAVRRGLIEEVPAEAHAEEEEEWDLYHQ